ncbi:MAG: hypothetical protein OEM32_07945, partial [Acidimicrobiia bacterium]|nr:hypothetical protein [Acidimicrobiia bacterium]
MLGDVTLDGSRWRIGSASFSNPRRAIVARTHEEVRASVQAAEAEARSGHWVVGYIGYDAAPGFNMRLKVRGTSSLPLVWFGVYDAPVEGGHSRERVSVGPWEASMSQKEHADAV